MRAALRRLAVLWGTAGVLSSVLWASPTGSPSRPPEAALSAYWQGQSRWQAGELDRAEESLRTAARLAPEWGEPRAALGVLCQQQDRDDEAREYYVQVQSLSLGPEPAGLTPELRPLRAKTIALEAYTCSLINQERRVHGLKLLLPDPILARVARQHSEEMRDLQYFAHESPVPGMTTVADRFRRVFGVRPRCIAENVARRWGLACELSEAKLLDSHRGLMASPGHRANILYPTVQVMGVGLATNLAEEYWLTETFLERRE